MAEDKTEYGTAVMNVELSEAESRNLGKMFKHSGWKVFLKILEGVKKDRNEDAFGDNTVKDIQVYLAAQEAHQLTKDISEMPEDLERELAEIDKAKKAEKEDKKTA